MRCYPLFLTFFDFQNLSFSILDKTMSYDADTWSCTRCSFENHPDIVFCEMCEEKRDLGSSVVPEHPVDVSDTKENHHDIATGGNEGSNWTVEKAVFQMDDCSCTSGILELLKTVLVKDRIPFTISWPYCSHFSQRNSFGASWSCGYRNIQMISSALMQIPVYREKLYSGKGRMPNIRIIQQWIEEAWKDGFDTEVSWVSTLIVTGLLLDV